LLIFRRAMKVKDLKTNAVYELVSYKATTQDIQIPDWIGRPIQPMPMSIDMSMRLDQVMYSVSYTKYFGDEVRFEITNDKGEVIQL
jgi:hypothetical protein